MSISTHHIIQSTHNCGAVSLHTGWLTIREKTPKSWKHENLFKSDVDRADCRLPFSIKWCRWEPEIEPFSTHKMTMLQSLDMFVAYQANTINFLSRSLFFGFFFSTWEIDMKNGDFAFPSLISFPHYNRIGRLSRYESRSFCTGFLFCMGKKLSRLVRQKIRCYAKL